MNIIDLGIIGVLLLFMAIGYYRGFLVSLMDFICSVASSLLAWALYLPVARTLNAGDKLVSMLMGFSESADIVGSVELFNANVSSLSAQQAQDFINGLVLPPSVSRAYLANLTAVRYADKGIVSAGDYLSRTISEHSVNILAFLLVFFLGLILMMVAVRLADYTVSLPALKYADGISGALIGFLTGSVVLAVLFTIIPVAQAFLPFDELRMLVDGSQFSQLFYSSNWFLHLIHGFIS